MGVSVCFDSLFQKKRTVAGPLELTRVGFGELARAACLA